MRPAVGVVLAWLLCGVVGCGSGEPFDMLPVSGKVTYEDGSPISAARIEVTFEPQVEPIDQKTHARHGVAEVNVKDGTFSKAASRKPGDGLVVGRHKVRVFSYDKQEKRSECQVTPSEIEVGPESTEFHFKVQKP
jgi:hypothetical protein